MSELSQGDKFSVATMNQKTVYIGSGAPATTYDGQFWVDVSTDPPVVKVYDDTNAQWMTYHPTYYEEMTDWANPTVTPVSNGTMCVVYKTTVTTGTRLYVYSNGAWTYLTTAECPVVPTITFDDTDISTDTVLDVSGIWYIDPVSGSEISFQHSTEGWFDSALNTISASVLCLSDGTNARVTYSTNAPQFSIVRTIVGGITKIEGSLATTASVTIPTGIFSLMTSNSNVVFQCNDGAGWVTVSTSDSLVTSISDGTNFRLYNGDGSTQYYVIFHETTPS